MLHPHPTLRLISTPVEDFGQNLKVLIQKMEDIIVQEQAAGLAAPQIGISKRLFLVEDGHGGIISMINPILTITSKITISMIEGCLSIPDYFKYVLRPRECNVKYKDWDNKEHEIKASGWLARAVLHENDHLDGRLMVDYVK